ncbi:hypothetical protein LNP05_19935 [Klebsiella pneumoniae subsp. pneumoniae]|nr:hypothetical protein [Klebsiella pneumoniae subsp. pneumoniae]
MTRTRASGARPLAYRLPQPPLGRLAGTLPVGQHHQFGEGGDRAIPEPSPGKKRGAPWPI